jgi:glycosyltransferase involved in cell wall biosynthesis
MVPNMKMKVGIYNRWLATLGGGEKLSLAIAEYLSKQHDVEVINHNAVSKQLAAERLNLDLSRVNFLNIPDRPASEITQITKDYNLFINASHLDYFPSLAEKSVALIYFPAAFSRRIALKRQLKHYIRERLKMPVVMAGVHAFDASEQIFRWSADTVLKIRLPRSNSVYHLIIDLKAADPRVGYAVLTINNQIIGKVNFDNLGEWATFNASVPINNNNTDQYLTISIDRTIMTDGTPKIWVRIPSVCLPQYKTYQLLEKWNRRWAMRLQYDPPGTSMIDYIDTYDTIWTISEFVRKWVVQYWDRESEILYPAVNVEHFFSSNKSNRILTVGRFFAGQHNKKHLEMISAFRGLVDGGLYDWEFHLAGGTTHGEENEAYLEQLYSTAQGYPIHIHTDISFDNLVNLYAESPIYWHASGFDEDENVNPEKFEHFGITTVEAMAAGCIPVVINKGGQPEIVEHDQSGFLWNTLSDLQAQTLVLINNPSLRKKMSKNALERSRAFGIDRFQIRLDDLLRKIVIP